MSTIVDVRRLKVKLTLHEALRTFMVISRSFLEGEMSQTKVTDDNIIRRMRRVCWIPKVTNTLSECVIFLAFPYHL